MALLVIASGLYRLLHKAHGLNIKGCSYWLRDLEQSLGMQSQSPELLGVLSREIDMLNRRNERHQKEDNWEVAEGCGLAYPHYQYSM